MGGHVSLTTGPTLLVGLVMEHDGSISFEAILTGRSLNCLQIRSKSGALDPEVPGMAWLRASAMLAAP
jgi:hypothetical protein